MDGNIDREFAFKSFFLDTTLPASPMFQGEREFAVS